MRQAPKISRGGGARPPSPVRSRVLVRPPASRSRSIRPNDEGLIEDIAAPSALVVRYPAALDTPPAFAGDQSTPVVGLFHNYLGLLIEAVQAEIGPMDLKQFSVPSTLMFWLGTEVTGSRISNWRSQAKTSGGNAAGQIFGLHKRVVSGTGSLYDSTQSTSFNALQGQHPAFKTPVLLGTMSAGGLGAGVFAGPATIRGGVTGSPIGTYQANYRGANGLFAGGSTANPSTFQADLLIVYMVEAF